MPKTVEQGPGDESPGLTGVPEIFLQQEDPVRILRRQYADGFRNRLNSGEVSNGIRPLAIFAAECKEIGIPVTNLTIGDIDWRHFPQSERLGLADGLGLYPLGAVHRRIDSYANLIFLEHMDKRELSVWSYQPEATGLRELRLKFIEFINGFGFSYTPEQTFLTPGSLPGFDNAIGAIRYFSHTEGRASEFLFPQPGFSVIRAQAVRRLIPVTDLPTCAGTGFCVEEGTLRETLKAPNTDRSMLYLTPMNNPTSTVYDAGVFKRTLSEFRRLRPNGIILADFAYIEMVDRDAAHDMAATLKSAGTDNVIAAVSMSKLFGDPRLRMGALFASDPVIAGQLQKQWQTVFASHSNAAEIEALGRWEYVMQTARANLYTLFRNRQDALLDAFARLNAKRQATGRLPLIDMFKVFRDVPLYVYARVNGDFLELFEETGILGVPGEVFGDDPANGMVRFSMGMEDLSEVSASF